MTIDAMLQALTDLPFAVAIREGSNLFPLIETGHVIGVAMVLGTVAIVDLRLVGLGSHRRSAAALIGEVLPWTWLGFALAAVFGALLFASNAPVYFANAAFRVKLALLVAAGVNMAVFHLFTQRSIERWAEDAVPPAGARIAGLLSLGLWTVLVFYARQVGFTLAGGF
jgi:hypothetical protein